MQVSVRNGLSDLNPAAWDELVGADSPFLEWGWLASLEDSGCVGRQTGWRPQHLTIWNTGRLVGACPLYLKSHSQGEFVFDHGWAEAALRAGIAYYPKLLVAVPFTPVTGARFLTHPEADRAALVRLMGAALREFCRERDLSSVHVNFCRREEADVLAELGYVERTGYQYHWHNPGWQSFDDYLTALRSKRRTQVRRERQELTSQGIEITAHAGESIPEELFTPMFRLYKSTTDKMYWGQQYLKPQFFDRLKQRWKHRLLFMVARRHGRVVAGTFNVHKGDILYGRYWGTFEELRFLHFNVCYYASIDYCVRHGVRRFEPGAGGEFKHLRGFDPQPTISMHYISEPRLAGAVRQFLRKEQAAMAEEMEWLRARSALKRG